MSCYWEVQVNRKRKKKECPLAPRWIGFRKSISSRYACTKATAHRRLNKKSDSPERRDCLFWLESESSDRNEVGVIKIATFADILA